MSAMGRADNAVLDSSEVSTTATPDKVIGLTLGSLYHAFSTAESGWCSCFSGYLSAALQQVQRSLLQRPEIVALRVLQSEAIRHLLDLRHFCVIASASCTVFKLCSWSCAGQLPIHSLLLGFDRWSSLSLNCVAGDGKSGNKCHS